MQWEDNAIASNFLFYFENEKEKKGLQHPGVGGGLREILIFNVLVNQIFFHMIFERD